jgi:hypothetical protein
MVKAPSSHGLDKKFKSWRKGKSQNPKSKNRTSLKHQLRGQTRLLTKVQDEEHRVILQAQIDALKEEIAVKEAAEMERDNAQKSHGARFLERQRLVRQERNVRKNPNLSDAVKEAEFFKIALDMAYVAHFPHDVVKYMPLFFQGTRIQDSGRHLNRRAVTRTRVLAKLGASSLSSSLSSASYGADMDDSGTFGTSSSETRVSWISTEMYGRLPKQEWSLELEKATFAGGEVESGAAAGQGGGVGGGVGGGASNDNRFAANNMESSAALLEAAEEIETKLDQEETLNSKKEESSSESSVADSADDADASKTADPPVKNAGAEKKAAEKKAAEKKAAEKKAVEKKAAEKKAAEKKATATAGDDKDKSSSDSSSSSSSDSDSDSDSNDSSDSSDEEDAKKSDESTPKRVPEVEAPKADEIMEEVDDFLVPVDEGKEQDFFKNAKNNIPTREELKGDKSKGWATQNQRPGDFRKKRIRR